VKFSIKNYFTFLIKYIKHKLLWIILLAFILSGSIIIKLINPQIIGFIIDSAVNGQDVQVLFKAALLFIATSLFNQLLIICATSIGQNIAWYATNTLRLDLIEHCLRLDMSFYKAHTKGEIIEKIDGDSTELFNFFSNLIINMFNNIFLILGVIALLFYQSIVEKY